MMHSRRQILVKSPDFNRTIALQLDPAQSVLTLSGITSLLESSSSHRNSLSDFCVALDGKLLNGSTRIQVSKLPSFSMLTLYPRLRGGGGDGGATGAESRDCYLNMYAEKKPDKVDRNEQRLSKWLNCALSNEPLAEPCVIDLLGNLFNKEALVHALLSKRVPKQFSHIEGLKDMVNIKLTPVAGSDGSSQDTTSSQFQCPVSGLEFNGKYKFFALRRCAHVMSSKALKEVKSSSCLVCHADVKESDKIVINGTEEEVSSLREKMEEEKAKLREKKAKLREEKAKLREMKGVSNKSQNGTAVVADTGAKVAKMADTGAKVAKMADTGAKVAKRQMDDGNVNGNGITVKKFKAADKVPVNATKEVYASLFTSSKKKSDFRETYSCRSLPLGRN
ncbi:PREDICTED: protein RTF2 homolog isoform X2 [Camelina sativa]|uniref:Protein RTF2 homolog isoform X2 n=1 Tax=Camelina sativa TaxID=90675 RepID=A0ABM1RAJ2_CAMSA|nr:PREDICTED: protein RTF2 homolog isoform X2 [Camelina sativa]